MGMPKSGELDTLLGKGGGLSEAPLRHSNPMMVHPQQMTMMIYPLATTTMITTTTTITRTARIPQS